MVAGEKKGEAKKIAVYSKFSFSLINLQENYSADHQLLLLFFDNHYLSARADARQSLIIQDYRCISACHIVTGDSYFSRSLSFSEHFTFIVVFLCLIHAKNRQLTNKGIFQ